MEVICKNWLIFVCTHILSNDTTHNITAEYIYNTNATNSVAFRKDYDVYIVILTECS